MATEGISASGAAVAARAEGGVRQGVTERYGQLLLLAPAVAVVVLTIVVPLGMTLWVSGWHNQLGVLSRSASLDAYTALLESDAFWATLRETALTLVIVVAGAVLLAYPVAYFLAHIVPPAWRIPLFVIAVIPFWTSYLTRMQTFFPLLSREGVINSAAGTAGVGPWDALLFSRGAQWGVQIVLYALFAVGPIFFALARIDRSFLEAAGSLGANGWHTFRRVVLPMSMPGVLTAVGFLIIMVMQDFATPLFIGGGKHAVLANVVLLRSQILDWPTAAAICVILTGLTFVLVTLCFRLARLRHLV